MSFNMKSTLLAGLLIGTIGLPLQVDQLELVLMLVLGVVVFVLSWLVVVDAMLKGLESRDFSVAVTWMVPVLAVSSSSFAG